MARRRRGLFHRRSSGRRIRRSRRGVKGPMGFLQRFLNMVTNRPLKVVSGALGITALLTILFEGSSTGDGTTLPGHILNAVAAAKAGNNADLSFNLTVIPKDIIAGVTDGKWIGPAFGAIVTGAISKAFRI